jgi:hypothetical protein
MCFNLREMSFGNEVKLSTEHNYVSKHRFRRNNNIKYDLEETACKGAGSVNTVTGHPVQTERENFLD